MADTTNSSNQSIKRIFSVIETMAAEGKPMRLQDIATRCKASSSTIMRSLNAMIENGYAHQDPETQLYSLSFKFLEIGSSIRENLSLSSLLHPYLREIAVRTGISCAIAVSDGKHLTYIDEVVPTHNMVRIHHHLGKGFPLYLTASGKVYINEMTPAERNEYIRHEKFVKSTEKTITTKKALLEDMKSIDARGYGYNDEEAALGMRCIAVPIKNSNSNTLAVLSISGTIYTINDETRDEIYHTAKEVINEMYLECMPALNALTEGLI